MNNNWLGADLFLTPPEGNGSDEDSGDDEEILVLTMKTKNLR